MDPRAAVVDDLEIDGAYGEGGGQTLRTAVGFSVIRRRPVRVTQIRAGRNPPGLKNQHVFALTVLSKIFGAELKGATVGSSEIYFSPGELTTADLTIDMKTAASISLVLQAVIPAVALTQSKIRLELRGGTDVPWSPTFDYLSLLARGAYREIGIDFNIECRRRGYYPKGGGVVSAEIFPSKGVRQVDLTQPATNGDVHALSRSAMLPRHVAERQLDSAAQRLVSAGHAVLEKVVSVEEADSPGSSLLLYSSQAGAFIGSDGLGERGKRAETIGEQTANRMIDYLSAGACVDPNLADMMAPLLCVAAGESRLRIPRTTLHLETVLYVARLFTGAESSFEKSDLGVIVTIKPS